MFYKKKEKTSFYWKFRIILFVFATILFTGYGYAALNQELQISGEAIVQVDADIRITDLKLMSVDGGAYETYNNKYGKNSTSMYVTLPSHASIIYEIEVTNKSNEDYMLDKLVTEFKNVQYELINFHTYDVVEKQTKKTIEVKVLNNNPNLVEETLHFYYQFSLVRTTAPILQGGGATWIDSPSIISVLEPGVAPNGVKHYEYYVSSFKEDAPNKDTIATGITDNIYSFTTGGIFNIYYRTVSNYGTKSDWTNALLVKNYKLPIHIITSGGALVPGFYRIQFNEYDCIINNSNLTYDFTILSDCTGVDGINLDFNDVEIGDTTIVALGNNRYRISGILKITEYMVTGMPTRIYAYDKMRFIDVNTNGTYVNFENVSVILQS